MFHYVSWHPHYLGVGSWNGFLLGQSCPETHFIFQSLALSKERSPAFATWLDAAEATFSSTRTRLKRMVWPRGTGWPFPFRCNACGCARGILRYLRNSYLYIVWSARSTMKQGTVTAGWCHCYDGFCLAFAKNESVLQGCKNITATVRCVVIMSVSHLWWNNWSEMKWW